MMEAEIEISPEMTPEGPICDRKCSQFEMWGSGKFMGLPGSAIGQCNAYTRGRNRQTKSGDSCYPAVRHLAEGGEA